MNQATIPVNKREESQVITQATRVFMAKHGTIKRYSPAPAHVAIRRLSARHRMRSLGAALQEAGLGLVTKEPAPIVPSRMMARLVKRG